MIHTPAIVLRAGSPPRPGGPVPPAEDPQPGRRPVIDDPAVPPDPDPDIRPDVDEPEDEPAPLPIDLPPREPVLPPLHPA